MRSAIPEDGRRAALVELAESRDRAQDEYAAARARLTEELRVANASYDMPPEELTEILSEFARDWESYRERVISVSLEMREQTTDAEWRELAEIDVESILTASGTPR